MYLIHLFPLPITTKQAHCFTSKIHPNFNHFSTNILPPPEFWMLSSLAWSLGQAPC